MVPYTYYRLCESYREADGKVRQRTVLGLGELTDFPKESQKRELAEQLTSMTWSRNGDADESTRKMHGKYLLQTSLKVRRSTTSESKLSEIQTALGISAVPVCSIKSVWLQERPS